VARNKGRTDQQMTAFQPPLGVILAGGLSRRMGGGDKPLRPLAGRTILDRVVERLRPQCAELILNANGDPARFAASGLLVVPDDLPDHPGPLAGILAALDWAAANRPEMGYVASVAADTPFLPRDFVTRLEAARAAAGAAMACAASGGRTHPVDALWPVSVRHALRTALVERGLRKMGLFVQEQGAAIATWEEGAIDPFLNVNAPEDLDQAAVLLARHGEP
jgi:molybdopterin-guanine dinucleotide biosynthesis protein A